ncbi:serine/threonine-protein kinase [Agromyces salentinus]|uniref:non-specific serine/threonine protein kinase n=1 Tax=Agromyces salentinus TaxID=269421 RepID=A0ABP4YR21_9MICO|nr:serine/threonine-protein kinase [Agromyces salentinus]
MTNAPEPVAGDPLIGTTLDARYRLDGLIGRGGMASVYRGEDLALGRPVAVKVFTAAADGIDDDERRKSETALLASLSHRALVRLYDASRDADTGREFLVMELVEGRDLRQALRLGPISPADAARMLADLAEALHVIHDRGIVHRDVKPANVLLEPAHLPSHSWNAKLADFGIARLIDDARLTSTGLLVGTPGYVSPEQVTGATPAAPADVYALGLLMLEARTGRAAFPGPAVESASARLVRDPEVPPSLGDDWAALLRSMTAREAGDRPTAIEVAVAASALETAAHPGLAAGDDIARAAAAGAVGADSAAGTGTTVAFGASTHAATDAATEAMAPPGAEDEASPAPDIDGRTGHIADGEATGATKVLPASAPPSAADSADSADSAGSAGSAGTRRRPRWVPAAVAAGVLLLVGAVVAVVVYATSTAPGKADPTPEPLPVVPGELGVHLEQLDEAVTG